MDWTDLWSGVLLASATLTLLVTAITARRLKLRTPHAGQAALFMAWLLLFSLPMPFVVLAIWLRRLVASLTLLALAGCSAAQWKSNDPSPYLDPCKTGRLCCKPWCHTHGH